eukprot:1000882_1
MDLSSQQAKEMWIGCIKRMILLMRKIEHHKENVANGDALSYPEIALLLNKRKAANKQRRQLNALKRTMKEYPPPKKYPFDSDNLNTSDCVISSIAFIDQLICQYL